MGDVTEPKFNKPIDYIDRDMWDRRSEEYNEAYKINLNYSYQCERYDKFICTGKLDEYGFIKPASGYEHRSINHNAEILFDDMLIKARVYNLSGESLLYAKNDVDRLSWKGLQEEYARLFMT